MNENEMNNDELKRMRDVIRAGCARHQAQADDTVAGVMARVRHQSVVNWEVKRRVRAARWAVASLSAAATLLVGVVGTILVSSPMPMRMARVPQVGLLPNEMTIALESSDKAVVSGGQGQVRLEQPMRLLVVNGALRVESVESTAAPTDR